MEKAEPEALPLLIAPGAALSLAVLGALGLAVADAVGFHTEAAETVYVGAGMMGWMFLFWGAVIAGCCAVLLIPRLLGRRPVSLAYAALLGTALALSGVTMALNPLWGSGSATATYLEGD